MRNPSSRLKDAYRAIDRRVRSRRDHDAIIGGVSRDLAATTGLDPFSLRVAFVVLAVFSGVGVPLYGGLWLILRGRRRSWSDPQVFAGIAVLFITFLLVALGGALLHIDTPWAVALILLGIALAFFGGSKATPRLTSPPRSD